MKNIKLYFVYYAILLVIFALRQTATSEPPMLLRLGYMAAVLVPVFYTKDVSYPAIITMFLTLTISGMNYSYMPYTLSLYVLITLIFLLFYNAKSNSKTKIPRIFIFFTLYVFFVDLVTGTIGGLAGSSFFESNFYCMLLIIMFMMIIGEDINNKLNQFSICYAASTIVLSILFLTIGRQLFTESYFGTESDRTKWTDPNYFGMIVAMGTILGLIQLFSKDWKELKLIIKLMYLSAIIISLPVLVLNASRGAVLSVVVAFVILILVSKTKSFYKGMIVTLAIIAVYSLYTYHYFDLLIERIEYDDGTGSTRTIIWKEKLNDFANGNVISMIFGYGRTGGANLGGRLIGFHNDFIGHLVDYGIVGFILFMNLLVYPIKIIPKKSSARPFVIVIIVYLATCFMTLEPFITGLLSYYVFYMYALLMAQNERDKSIKQIECVHEIEK